MDPSFSKDVVNAHVSTFIRTSLLTRFELTAEARQFLQDKLVELRVKLAKSEEDLSRFRKTHPIVALDKGENFIVDRLKGLNADLTQATSRRIELESLHRIVQQRDHQLLSQVIDNAIIRRMKEVDFRSGGRKSPFGNDIQTDLLGRCCPAGTNQPGERPCRSGDPTNCPLHCVGLCCRQGERGLSHRRDGTAAADSYGPSGNGG